MKCFGFLRDVILALLSSLLLVLSFPPYEVGVLAWVGLAPMMIAINGKGAGRAFLLGLAFGVAFILGMFGWILEVPGYQSLHHAVLVIFFGIYFAVFALLFNFVMKRCGGVPAFLSAPFLWVGLEYIRSNLSFLALPWGLVGHSQYRYLEVIQIASVVGVYGLSFLIVLSNSVLALVSLSLLGLRARLSAIPSGVISHRQVLCCLLPFLAMLSLTLFYGRAMLKKSNVGEELKISVVQANIEQSKKWDRAQEEYIMETYADLTRGAGREHPNLIVWPEMATPRCISRDAKLHMQVKDLARETSAYLLLGSAQHRKFGRSTSKLKFVNSAYLIKPDAVIFGERRHDKLHLLPFGEYLPWRGIIPWSLIDVPELVEYVPGREFTIFQLPPFRFGVTICWENIFPELVRQFVRNGAQFIVNITNEAWFGNTAAPYQFVSMSVFRAVENGVYVVRCANTGVSCFIDPHGRITDRVSDDHGQDVFVKGVKSGLIKPGRPGTFYTRYGDWPAGLSLLLSGFLLLASFFRMGKDTPQVPEAPSGSRRNGSR
jgi:apolipoprotein N-acyltransferase